MRRFTLLMYTGTEEYFEDFVRRGEGLLRGQPGHLPENKSKQKVRPVHGGADREAMAFIGIGHVSVAHDAKFEGTHLF